MTMPRGRGHGAGDGRAPETLDDIRSSAASAAYDLYGRSVPIAAVATATLLWAKIQSRCRGKRGAGGDAGGTFVPGVSTPGQAVSMTSTMTIMTRGRGGEARRDRQDADATGRATANREICDP